MAHANYHKEGHQRAVERTLSETVATDRTTVRHGVRLLSLIAVLLAASGCGGGGGSTGSDSTIPGVGAATLSWTPPSTRTDGTALTDLAGYHVYIGQTSPVTAENSFSVSVSDPSQTSYTLADLAPGTYYFTVTAVNLQGTESAMSEEAAKTIL